MRSSSEDLVGTFKPGAARAGTGRESATTVGRGRGAAGGGGGAAEAVGLGASQVPAGTREAAAALPTVVVRTVGPDEDGEETVADGRGTEGMVSLADVGAEAAMSESTFPTGVFMPTGATGSNLPACSLCAEYLAPKADSTRDMIRDGVTSDF